MSAVLGREPERSAVRTLDRRQRLLVATGVPTAFVLVGAAPIVAMSAFVTVSTFLYAAVLVHRIVLMARGESGQGVIQVSDEEARAVPDGDLPRYTVLVAAYRESTVIAELLHSLSLLEYPRDRLEIKLLFEEDDTPTRLAARRAPASSLAELVVVPDGVPRTKPRALNHGLRDATGELVTIYDAEDRPDPLQLRRAAVAFARVSDRVACLQAELSYHNAMQNLLTKWFTIEYSMWFRTFLPGLVATGAPLPLGGTSNHFRRATLEACGGWDPHNVTEDADLGMTLHRAGFEVGVLGSTTWEEANSDVVNWVKQRSRWYKGYLQTWLVHMRTPVELLRSLGPRGFVGFNLFVGGTPLLALLNPVFWALTAVWFLMRPPVIEAAFLPGVFHLALACWLLGNASFVYLNMLASRSRPELVSAALLSPAYWVLMSVAAVKAAVQLLLAPSFWEKTTHGLVVVRPKEAKRVA